MTGARVPSGNPAGGSTPQSTLLSSGDVGRVVDRMAHQIIENVAKSGFDAVLLGIPTRGVPLARRLAARIEAFAGVDRAGRLARHHALPRRPAAARRAPARRRPSSPRAASPARTVDPRRRRALLRTHDPGRARRAHRTRSPARRPARRARRPRSPGAADPRRLRRQERPDLAAARPCGSRSTETDGADA